MTRSIKNGKIIFLLVINICLLCSCGGQSQNGLHEFAQEYEEYGGNMLVLGLENDTAPTESGVVYLEAIDDNLNIQFANLTDSNSEYILKLFLDYREIEFVFDGESRSEYVFTANAGQSLVFPISLSGDIPFDTSHILTIAILTAPNKHAYTIDLMSNSYGMVLSYELANSANERLVTESAALEEPSKYLTLSYQGIMLNKDFEAENNTSVKFPPKKMEVKSGEPVNLAYRVGNYETSDDVIVVVLVDWKQQMINDKPYLHVANKTGYVGYGTLEFSAPSQAGEYEVSAFVVDDPYGLKDGDNFHTHDTSYRFTLIVE